LGVPWVARVALQSTQRTVIIEHDGLEWTETTISSVIRRTVHMTLDGSVHNEINPVDKTAVAMSTSFEENGRCISTRSVLANGMKQMTRRYIQDGGRTYAVSIELAVSSDQVIRLSNYFNREDN
ncbi:unnamed protein product, partial [Polarella glacialis]